MFLILPSLTPSLSASPSPSSSLSPFFLRGHDPFSLPRTRSPARGINAQECQNDHYQTPPPTPTLTVPGDETNIPSNTPVPLRPLWPTKQPPSGNTTHMSVRRCHHHPPPPDIRAFYPGHPLQPAKQTPPPYCWVDTTGRATSQRQGQTPALLERLLEIIVWNNFKADIHVCGSCLARCVVVARIVKSLFSVNGFET